MVLPVTIDPNPQMAPADSRDLTNHERAVQGISAILSRDLKLPMPERVTVYVVFLQPDGTTRDWSH